MTKKYLLVLASIIQIVGWSFTSHAMKNNQPSTEGQSLTNEIFTDSQESLEECLICFNKKTFLLKCLYCSQFFCKECADRWIGSEFTYETNYLDPNLELSDSVTTNSCPFCRHDITPADLRQMIEFARPKSIQEKLKSLIKQKSLDLSGRTLSDKEWDALVKILGSDNSLTSLNLTNTGLGPHWASLLGLALKTNNTLVTVNLKNNPMTDPAIIFLFPLKSSFTENLTQICLNNTKLGKDGMKSLELALILAHNKVLSLLQLDGNDIGEEGARHVSGIVWGAPNIQELSMAGCNLGDEGAAWIAYTLPESSLLALSIENNGITDKGFESFVFWLRNNKKLKYLGLANNPLGANGIIHASSIFCRYNINIMKLVHSLDIKDAESKLASSCMKSVLIRNKKLSRLWSNTNIAFVIFALKQIDPSISSSKIDAKILLKYFLHHAANGKFWTHIHENSKGQTLSLCNNPSCLSSL